MPKIGILITTFLRDDLLYETVQSIIKYKPDNSIILIGDQGYQTPEKTSRTNTFKQQLNDEFVYFPLDFDCGISKGRNELVKLAHSKDCEYCILGADSIQFCESVKNVDLLFSGFKNKDIIGLNLENRLPWEAVSIDLIPNQAFEFDFLRKKDGTFNEGFEHILLEKDIKIYNCEVVKNFFIAKTDTLLRCQWDEDLKSCEHEDYFYRCKQAGIKIGWTPDIKGHYVECKPQQYKKYRDRMYREFRLALQKKYNIRGWIKYKNYF